jgi:YegS/Rv2252/BmrU family lipid kinase
MDGKMMRYKIIVNPTSGRGTGERSIPQIEALLGSSGLDFDLVRTEKPWNAVALAQQAVADGFDVVVAAGGDGTANEVINGLMSAKVSGIGTAVMGVLPVGRGNDFAFSMGIPTDIETGCQILVQNHQRSVDVGRVTGGLFPDGRYFGNGLGIGFDAVVGFEAAKMKRLHGFASYVVAALKTIFLYFRAPMMRIEFDDHEITIPALMVSAMNGTRQGGGFMMAPNGSPYDGLFDVCIAHQVSRPQMFVLIQRFLAGTAESHDAIQIIRSSKVAITALEHALPAHGDGETICTDGTELTIELLPRQLEVVTQPQI